MIDDVDKFRYDVKDNRRLQQVAVHRVFRKTGRFIFQLGIVNFLEQLIIGLLLVIYVFNREAEIYAQAAEQKLGERIIELPYIRTHEFLMLNFGYNLGSVISLSTLQSTALERPYVPTIFQAFNIVLWILNL